MKVALDCQSISSFESENVEKVSFEKARRRFCLQDEDAQKIDSKKLLERKQMSRFIRSEKNFISKKIKSIAFGSQEMKPQVKAKQQSRKSLLNLLFQSSPSRKAQKQFNFPQERFKFYSPINFEKQEHQMHKFISTRKPLASHSQTSLNFISPTYQKIHKFKHDLKQLSQTQTNLGNKTQNYQNYQNYMEESNNKEPQEIKMDSGDNVRKLSRKKFPKGKTILKSLLDMLHFLIRCKITREELLNHWSNIKPEKSYQNHGSFYFLQCVKHDALDRVRQFISENGRLVVFDFDYKGRTCLHLACEQGQLEMAKVLVGYGADVEARDGKGQSVLKYALKHREVARYLLVQGCDPFSVRVRRSDESWEMVIKVQKVWGVAYLNLGQVHQGHQGHQRGKYTKRELRNAVRAVLNGND